MRFQDAAPDARAVVYAAIQAEPVVARAAGLLADASYEQRLLARAVMNGETTDAERWRAMFPSLFERATDDAVRARSEAILAASLDVADRGEQVRSQFRGAIVEELTARLLARRVPEVRRERRVLFDGVRAEIHPYDVTVEGAGRAEVYDCKWGARGINADVLHQLDDARRSCRVRLARLRPWPGVRLVALESLDALGRAKAPAASPARVPSP